MSQIIALPEVTCERDVVCLTRDGVALRADVYRPAGEHGPLPVLLTRTPYNKAMPLNADACRAIAARGYIAVTQDVRGTHASDGDYLAWWLPGYAARQAEDGYDAVEWAARLAGSDGRVGMFGVSYMARCSWSAAGARPPSLKAIHNAGITVSNLDVTFGIFDTGRRMQWIYAQAADQRRRAGRTDGPLTREAANAEWMGPMQGKWLWHLPLETIPEPVFNVLTGPFREMLGIQNRELYELDGVHDGLDIPVCTSTGWWDRLANCVRHYQLLQEAGAPATRARHRLVVGPWSHAPSSMRRKIGPRDYGQEADYPLHEQTIDWFDEVFKGKPPRRPAPDAPVRLFIVNENRWRGFDAWPPREAVPAPFYLHGGGAANSADGDGRLSAEPPGAQPADRYAYDPADPFMSLFAADSQNLPVDQSPHDYRRDNLVYQTAPLERDIVVAGVPELRLWAASDAPDTDFAVKLIEVGQDGLAINISQGIVRARFREGFDREVMLAPGVPTLFTIALGPVGIRFSRGSRIRLDIASSDFPAFDRNHNTGGRDWAETELRVAHQTVFHDADHPTALILPIIAD